MSDFSRPGPPGRPPVPEPPHPGPAHAAQVLGPSGKPITIDDLPPANTQRWVIRRKMAVVAGVRAGLITLKEAYRRYRLSEDEFASWQRLLDKHGPKGLRATRVQAYREPRDQDGKPQAGLPSGPHHGSP